ncbi:dodecin family protein [Dethiosulfatarculus sandiegensis]|uniref:Dodecin domain-containing protein n=1 Tax=Dethiosulfatarculus sandiegensis TaxID=1429043 RepID=A0A0D2JCX1_9BACT|nr:dodecin family protein [Dethiosulfatarculus sandiegensis]KIX13606.1 hypothetical protein X474_11265 [Dethiosulfatarculus sandiegensis]
MAEKKVARVTEIIASSTVSFDDAIKNGFERATMTLRGVTGIKIKEMRVSVADNQLKEYRVRMEVIFVLES